MGAVTAQHALDALNISMWSDGITIDTVLFSKTGTPVNEGFTSLLSGRNIYFHDFDSANPDYYTVDLSSVMTGDQGVLNFGWKPSYNQAAGSSRCQFSSRYADPVQLSGFDFLFIHALDDLRLQATHAGVSVALIDTIGLTWSANSLNVVTLFWDKTAGLTGGKSAIVYINNSNEGDVSDTWLTLPLSSVSKIGIRSFDLSNPEDGGIYALAAYSWDSFKANGYTVGEVAQYCYENTLAGDGGHWWIWEALPGGGGLLMLPGDMQGNIGGMNGGIIN